MTVMVMIRRGQRLCLGSRGPSSAAWIARHSGDEFRVRAKREGARSRAVYKLEEVRASGALGKCLTVGARVVDLGAAPGSWSLACSKIIGGEGELVSVDLLPFDRIPVFHRHPVDGGGRLYQRSQHHPQIVGNFCDPSVREDICRHLRGGKADLILSDMHGGATGDGTLDHDRSLELCKEAAVFAVRTLAPRGGFLCKVIRGGREESFADQLRRVFKKVVWIKPRASRSESREIYLCAIGYSTPFGTH